MKWSVNKTLFISIVFLLIFTGGVALAATASQPLNLDWPKSPLGTSLKENPNLLIFVKYLYEWMISLGGLAAFIALIYAGFLYLTSAGNVGKMRDARERITSTVWGLGLLFGAYIILNTINPQLTVLRLPDLIPSGTLPQIDLSLDLQKQTKPCDKVEVIDSARRSMTVSVDDKQSSIYPLIQATIYGSCKVSFYDNQNCKEKNLAYIEQTIVLKDDETEPKPIILTDRVPQGTELYCVGVDPLQNVTF
jgi:hypothetical protein